VRAGAASQTASMPSDSRRAVAVLAFPQAQLLDVTGPLEVFGRTQRWLAQHRPGARGYRVEILAERGGPVATSSLIEVVAHRGYRAARSLDTLLVAGGDGVARQLSNRPLLRWLVAARARVRRLGSVCTGAFLLAESGLLRGRRAVTHWAHCDELARRYPDVRVEADALYVRDGGLVSSAGVTAGMDLALALVEEDHGREVALEVARNLVLFLYRPGGQSQFSPQLSAQLAERGPIREVQSWIAANPDGDLSVPALARRAGYSPRQFARVFRAEVGVTPARYVESARIDVARRRLETSADSVERIAAGCGLGSSESLRRRFLGRLRVTPSAYRARFARKEVP
jgi:transcriptional regulator GlxA family with amidase domain